ncbi:hypothetical protein IKQ19_14110, partial [Candidatus Saccharibacteria bacterium]|nr:hypothetical protein [Candidatus Saccharibacteria bacterium]
HSAFYTATQVTITENSNLCHNNILVKNFCVENIGKVVSGWWLVVRDARDFHIKLVGGKAPPRSSLGSKPVMPVSERASPF